MPERCSACTVNAVGACSEETIPPEELPTHSEPGSDNLGTGLGRGPVLETGRQQRWDTPTAGREEVVTHWSHGITVLEVGFAVGSALETATALVPRCHKHRGGNSSSAGFENFLSNPVPPLHCLSQSLFWKCRDGRYLREQRHENYLIEETLRAFSRWSMLELPVTQQSLHLSGWSNAVMT